MKLIALCGMPGSGKSTFKELAHQLFGVPSWYVGQPLADACLRAGIEPTYAHRMTMGFRLGLFDASDPLKFINYSLGQMKIRHPHAAAIVFDSVRSIKELQFLRSFEEETTLVAVILGRPERVRRLVCRDHIPVDQVESRDRMEIGLCDPFHRGLGVGQLVAMADHYVLTPSCDAPAPDFACQVKAVLHRLGVRPRSLNALSRDYGSSPPNPFHVNHTSNQ